MGQCIRLAAVDSSPQDKLKADVVCSGHNDEKVINEQIEKLERGGTIQLLDGNYYLDAFDGEDRSAICFGFNNGKARVIHFIGDTENKSYNTRFGVCLHVTKQALSGLQPGETGRVFCGTAQRPAAQGHFFTFTYVNNVAFENFYLFFDDVTHPVVGIDGIHFGGLQVKRIGIYSHSYFEDRFLHRQPPTPCKGLIGIQSTGGANDEPASIGFDTVEVGGLYIGIHVCGMEHLIMQDVSVCRCCYGYVFESSCKTLTMISCDDEGNTHLPVFRGRGQLTCLDFNIERFSFSPTPQENGETDESPFAHEQFPGAWHGQLSYTIDGDALGKHPFWQEGHGLNFKTVNLLHEINRRPEVPERYETYFDPQTNKSYTWTGEYWVDALGQKSPDEPTP